MKKLLSCFLILALVLGLTACKERTEDPAQTDTPVAKDYDSFRENTEEMTLEEAEAYLQDEAADQTADQYKEALYTVNENAVSGIIEAARDAEEVTEEVTELFSGIFFKFLNGDQFSEPKVQKKLAKLGSFAAAEDGWYCFTFYDRTLAQAAADMENDHALEEYTAVLELLLSDPNVTVKNLNQ